MLFCLVGRFFRVQCKTGVRTQFQFRKVSKMASSQDLSDVFAPNPIPKSTITVIYNDKPIELGQELKIAEVENQPQVKWENNDPAKFYTLLMIDQDAPTRNYSFLSPLNHWLVVNIVNCDLASGEVICEYRGAGAPKHTGLHRYVFLLFEHEEKVSFKAKIGKDDLWARLRLNLGKFMAEHKFETIYAYNYFNAQWNPPPPSSNSRKCAIL